MGYRETPIQQAVLTYLQFLENRGEAYYVRNNSFSGHITRANGSRGYIKNAKPGAPDIIVLVNGYWLGLEIKANTRQSPAQRAAEKAIEKCGGLYLVVHDVRVVERVIKRLLTLSPTPGLDHYSQPGEV